MEERAIDTITSIESYLSWVRSCNTADVEGLTWQQHHLFFRGQADNEWRLQPSVFVNKENEYRLLQDAYRHAWKYLQDYHSDLEKMIVLQHYGLHTRLLDLTSNPLIALYFACVGEQEKDGIVYCFCSNGEESVRIPKIIAEIVANGIHLGTGLNQYLRNKYETFYIRKKGTPVEEDNYNNWKAELFKAQFFLSPFNNNRITAQRGAFIIAPLITPDSINYPVFSPEQIESMKNWHSTVGLIDAKSKSELLEDLARLGIDESTVFPDLEHLLKFLNRKHQPNRNNIVVTEIPQQ